MVESYVPGALSAFFTSSEKQKYGSGEGDTENKKKKKKVQKSSKRAASSDAPVEDSVQKKAKSSDAPEEDTVQKKKAKGASLFDKYPDRVKPEPQLPRLHPKAEADRLRLQNQALKKKKKKVDKENAEEVAVDVDEAASPADTSNENTSATAGDKPKRRKKNDFVKMTSDERERSVFVGNVPLDATRKELTKLFSEFGKVDSCRFRSAVADNVKLPKKAVVVGKKFGEAKQCFNAYIKFVDKESAEKALSLNGQKLREHQLRVDGCARKKQYDAKTTVFIGNVFFKATEDQLIEHFSVCGEVDFVRIVRDAQSGVGKGFGFVGFKDSASTLLALNMNDQPFQERPLRVTSIAKKSKRYVSGDKHKVSLASGKKKPQKKEKKKVTKFSTYADKTPDTEKSSKQNLGHSKKVRKLIKKKKARGQSKSLLS